MSLIMRRKATRYSIVSKRREVGHDDDDSLEKQNDKAQAEAACPICQEPIGRRSPDGVVESWSMLPCGHRFGSYCIKHYLRVVADDRPSCPVCRRHVYHACGHPVMPSVLAARNPAKADSILEACDLLVAETKYSPCPYCAAKAVTGARVHGTAEHHDEDDDNGEDEGDGGNDDRARRRLPFGLRWLRFLSRTRRRRGREQQQQQQQETVTTTTTTTTTTATVTYLPSGYEGYYRDPQSQDGVWQGSYIDPFPRLRDAAWEKWWLAQEPKGA